MWKPWGSPADNDGAGLPIGVRQAAGQDSAHVGPQPRGERAGGLSNQNWGKLWDLTNTTRICVSNDHL